MLAQHCWETRCSGCLTEIARLPLRLLELQLQFHKGDSGQHVYYFLSTLRGSGRPKPVRRAVAYLITGDKVFRRIGAERALAIHHFVQQTAKRPPVDQFRVWYALPRGGSHKHLRCPVCVQRHHREMRTTKQQWLQIGATAAVRNSVFRSKEPLTASGTAPTNSR